ncbi:MAG: GNAT family N-acetyltransferase [Cellvibrionaceae bacterium]|nr:GNAT family N-acetyltransferase [Cellvibrionaceae bacterium]
MDTVKTVDFLKCFAFLETLIIPPDTGAGHYTVRFAQTEVEVQAAQALRYQVFYQEKQGRPTASMMAVERDFDQWDDAGFHIIVLDTRAAVQPAVVGTLRLFFNESLAGGQGFYTEETFNLQKLHDVYRRSLELSRFCVDPKGRGGVILMLIWKFAMSFLQDNHIDVMFGCASFTGTKVDAHLPILHYLYEHHLAPAHLRPVPIVADYIDLNQIFEPNANWQEAQKSVPTLLRGYLKLGAKISDAAIIDRVFNTVYVAIYVETNHMLQQNPNLVSHV